MATSLTGARPLPFLKRAHRMITVSWNFAVIYLGYKVIQWQKWLSDEEHTRRFDQHNLRVAKRMYRLATTQEGLLIKMCQAMSSRADVAPVEFIKVLSRLQDRVPARPWPEVRRQIRRELGAWPEEIYASFEKKPIAAASLAQVHRATTKDGRDVAVKVQYPGIDRVMETDLRNIGTLVRLLARIEPNFDFTVLMDEMERSFPRELDFEMEGRSAERVMADLSHRKDVRIPQIVWEHTARRVLTMEYIDAMKISDIPSLEEAGIDTNEVARIMMEAYCEQILVHGFFHADPHPGNLMVLPGPTVVFLDFGLSKELPEEFRLNYAKLTMAIFTQNDDAMVEAFRATGFKTKTDDPETLIALGRSFFDSAGPAERPYTDKDVMPEVNAKMATIIKQNPVTEIPADVLLIFRVIGLMSGLQKRLDSVVNMSSTITPFAASQVNGDGAAEAASGAG